nr:hypothetical protein [Paenibacillus larvae]
MTGDPYSDLEKQAARLTVQFTKQPGTLLLRHIPVLQLAWKNWFFQIIKILARQRERPLAGPLLLVLVTLIRKGSTQVWDSLSLLRDFQHSLPAIIPIHQRIPLILPILQGKIGSIN